MGAAPGSRSGVPGHLLQVVLEEIQDLLPSRHHTALMVYGRDSGLAPIDHQGGVMAGREEILDFLEDNLEKMAGDTGA